MISIRDLRSNLYLLCSQISLNFLAILFRLSIGLWVRFTLQFSREPLPNLHWKHSDFYQAFYTPFFPCHCLILHTMQSVHFLPAPSYNFSLFCGPFSVYSTV